MMSDGSKKISPAARVLIGVWWLVLEIPSVYAAAHPTGHPAAASDWFMGAMLGTTIASAFCGLSVMFVHWLLTGENPLD